MSQLSCPKCRAAVSDDALDAGQCPACGYDGAMMATGATAGSVWLIATVVVLAGGLALGTFMVLSTDGPRSQPDPILAFGPGLLPASSFPPAATPEPAVAPEPRPSEPVIGVAPEPRPHVAVAPRPKPNPWNPPKPGPVVVLDPRDAADRKLVTKIENPNGTIAVPDLTGKDHIQITGRARLLKIGSLQGHAVLDASALEAEEIVISGDLHKSAVVKLHAPGGAVTIGGHIVGSTKLTIHAPGGTVKVAAKSGRLGGATEVTILAGRVEILGAANEGARVAVTLTSGGFLKVALMDGSATITCRKSAPTDPEPKIETGELRGGTKVDLLR
jgi:hypothetical protein